jgi:hypothetical protein
MRYSDSAVLAMCGNASLWLVQLRNAAKQRKLPCTSVTPISDVVALLRGSINEKGV